MSTTEFRRLKAFGRHVHAQLEREGRALTLLDQINGTFKTLHLGIEKIAGLNVRAENHIAALEKHADGDFSQFENLIDVFTKLRDIAGEVHALSVEKRKCALADARLTPEDGIVDAYDTLLEGLAVLHNNFNRLAWIIGENVAESDKVAPSSFKTSKELFAALEE